MLSGISSVKAETTHGNSFLHIKSRTSQDSIDAQVHILGRITLSLPRSTITNCVRNTISTVPLAGPSFYRSLPIDILLKADYGWNILTINKLLDVKGNVLAIFTIFGWAVTSVISSRHQHVSSSLLTLVDIDQSLRGFWEIEKCNAHTVQDDVEQHLQDTHRRHADGRYIVELPFKEENAKFDDTHKGALT